ncbi:Cell division cycle 5-like protein [Galdieria sulphuraria]|nr:Cell division cycle 5-like protein [Galdieria sulphuraria]
MRYFIKGGVWKNSEDEILKAAVMKYGKNQWARISSLLVRKSAKQCKARWYEWLDPSIKKTDWTREEEEKLLHLAKVMPNQWRTIAPIIGRTASQCLEHYERLIDEAQRELEGGAEGSSEELRKLRPGEIDPTPETRPARPDPVDMDEDEKEMLSEARARLANTKGKKAKRKAREKQLEEAKRLAILQKKRELKAAGLRVGTRIRIKGFNYVEEIPFEKKPPPGFFDVIEEEKESEHITKELKPREVGQLIEKYEGKRRIDQEAAARKLEAKRRRLFEEQNLPETLKNNYEKEREQILKGFQRTALKLPEPQINDEELQMLRKSSLATEEYQQYGRVGERSVTENLLADYSKTPTPHHYSRGWNTPSSTAPQSASQTPILETWNETKRREARDLLHMSSSQTPLEGGENLPLTNMNFSQGLTPKQKTIQTPNPLLTPSAVSPSPFSSVSASPSSSNMEEKARMKLLRKKLQQGLQLLPAPQNEYKLTVSDELEEDREEEQVGMDDSSRVEDARDEMERKRRAEERKREEEKKFWPTAEQLDLPFVSSGKRWSSEENLGVVERLILHEVNYLLQQSHLMREMKADSSSEKDFQILLKVDPMYEVPKEYFELAMKQVDEEKSRLANLIREYESCCDVDDPYLGVFSEENGGSLQGFIKEANASMEVVVGSRRHEWEHLIAAQNNVKANIEQIMKYIDIHHGGYWKRLENLNNELNDHIDQIEELIILKSCYERAEKREAAALQDRLLSKERLTKELKERELSLQKQYGQLVIERDRLLSRKL